MRVPSFGASWSCSRRGKNKRTCSLPMRCHEQGQVLNNFKTCGATLLASKKRKPPHRAPTRPTSVTGDPAQATETRSFALPSAAHFRPFGPCPAFCPVPSIPDSLEVRCAVLSPPHRFRLIKPQAARFVKSILTVYCKKAFCVFLFGNITFCIIKQMCKFGSTTGPKAPGGV